MKLRKSLPLLLIFVLLFPVSVSTAEQPDSLGWTVVLPGIDYTKIHLPDPNNVFVVRMDRSNTNLTLESTIANGKLAEGRETVSGMFNRYDQAINYWGGGANPPTWGMRNQAVVAINGSYFDYGNGMPWGGQIQSGWYAKRYDNLGGWSGFAWKLDRSAFIGECVNHRPEKQLITYPATGKSQEITRINDYRDVDELVLFTPQYNSRTGTSSAGVEVVVEMARPSLILPTPNKAVGIIREIHENEGNSLIPFNSIVLSASGSAAQTLVQNAEIGSEIYVSQEITPYLDDCKTTDNSSWTKTYASIQGAYFFLKNSQIRDFTDSGATSHNPRTAIAYNAQYIFFIVVDGRDTEHSVGMTIHELAAFALDTLGATWGVAQDGGGSSTLVINGQVVNNTFCNIYTCQGAYHIYLPFTTKAGFNGKQVYQSEPQAILSVAGIERPVANGMLMVVVQPEAYSKTYMPGDQVTTSGETTLRLGPGTNYDSFATLPAGTHGVILQQMNSLQGVLAKGNNWWYVDFGEYSGWIAQGQIIRSVLAPENNPDK
ncbi:MAG: hypothetical protein C3F13_04880 [Anaerolineales bacterium]|nr:MAG: hypothetical protein C3F13_04880 [Anaerolineales bacterium]